MRRSRFFAFVIVSMVAALGCSSPSSPSARSSRPTIAAPIAVAPQGGMLIGDLDQPLTLSVQNPATVSQVGAITLTFEVSSDANFAMVLDSKTVAAAAGDHTSVIINPLPANARYYWRAWAAADNAIRTIPTPALFRIGPAIASGPYRLTIDATAAGCGDLFAQPIVVDAVLTRTGTTLGFSLPGNGHCGGFAAYNCGGVGGTLAGSSLSGSAYFHKGVATSPTGAWLNGEVHATAVVHADATISGSFDYRPHTSDFALGVSFPSASGLSVSASCLASIPWTLAPQ